MLELNPLISELKSDNDLTKCHMKFMYHLVCKAQEALIPIRNFLSNYEFIDINFRNYILKISAMLKDATIVLFGNTLKWLKFYLDCKDGIRNKDLCEYIQRVSFFERFIKM